MTNEDNGKRRGNAVDVALIDRIVELIALGASVKEISTIECVTESTVYRWIRDPEIKARVQGIRRAIMSSVQGRLTGYLQAAMDRINEITKSEDERTALVACTTLADMILKLEEQNHSDRIEQLERRLGVLKEREMVPA